VALASPGRCHPLVGSVLQTLRQRVRLCACSCFEQCGICFDLGPWCKPCKFVVLKRWSGGCAWRWGGAQSQLGQVPQVLKMTGGQSADDRFAARAAVLALERSAGPSTACLSSCALKKERKKDQTKLGNSTVLPLRLTLATIVSQHHGRTGQHNAHNCVPSSDCPALRQLGHPLLACHRPLAPRTAPRVCERSMWLRGRCAASAKSGECSSMDHVHPTIGGAAPSQLSCTFKWSDQRSTGEDMNTTSEDPCHMC
jgi:hypothetical protein